MGGLAIDKQNTSSQRQFISDVVDVRSFKHGVFNLIASGCGTGKSYFVGNTLLRELPDVHPQEVVFVTSRSITKEQQSGKGAIEKFKSYDGKILRFWNKEDESLDNVIDDGIKLMCYSDLINIIIEGNRVGYETLSGLKAIVFDECHTIFADKSFITNMAAVSVWLREASYRRNILLIGLTATPEVMYYEQDKWGIEINQVNTGVIPGYKAKEMICTTYESIPALVCGGRLKGKTMIMCRSVEDCLDLERQIPNSTVLVSPYRDGFTNEMRTIRDFIIKNETLPEKFKKLRGKTPRGGKPKYDYYPLNVLITTSTAREGFNLREESGVRNIISCFTDSMDVTQFAGRARYNLDTIVVAHTYRRSDNYDPSIFMRDQRRAFHDFLLNKSMVGWYAGVSEIVEGTAMNVKRFVLSTGELNFVSYINSKWLVPPETTEEAISQYRIWRDKDKNEIVKRFIENRVWCVPAKIVTFAKVISILQSCLGYEVETDRRTIEGSQRMYKLVVSFEKEKLGVME